MSHRSGNSRLLLSHPATVQYPAPRSRVTRLAMIESRLATLEARNEFLATKEDIQKLSTLIAEKEASMQRWLMGVLLTAMVGMGIALIRLFS